MRRLLALSLFSVLPFAVSAPPAHADVCVILVVGGHVCQASCPPGYKGVVVIVGNVPVLVCTNLPAAA